MLANIVLSLATLAATAYAHFRIPFPGERNATNFDTQTTGPCGGDNSVVSPRYKWNPEGSPLELLNHHVLSVFAIYFCPYASCTESDDFDVLLSEPLDLGKGNFCVSALELPSKYNNVNQTGTIQVIAAGTSDDYGEYEYMYNCVDIIVSEDGPVYDGTQCSNSTEIEYDEGADSIYESEGTTLYELESVSEFTALNAYWSSTMESAAKASGVTSMSGMTMDAATTIDDMSGMDMGTTTTSGSTSASESASVAASATESSTSTAGAATNVISYSFIALLSAFLLL
ncbi:hypothetical protein CANARDRAFT_7367 [[Candida] arabinofermentans NRRL YB-2248]|uniref:Copper acquisition factor BIM1-like domain-containing protein n=1 Tax=[Candida] arabinofermentans NRRL YB-2248 TaxID=983967 RepID=A0A1E4T2N3_9ASCO|nr:hypothetical protein CANARDRAFT_7367 [[Candida] arabinofermentans NRRL YB-2248]